MAEIPHFTLGSYGKLTSEAMNALIEQAYSVAPTEQSQTPLPVFGPGNFPIYARLGSVITEEDKEPPKGDGEGGEGGDGGGGEGGDGDGGEGGDGEGEAKWTPRFGGYTWQQVSWSSETLKWTTSQSGLSYNSEYRNAAYALGVEWIDAAQAPDYQNSYVMLFPANDKAGEGMLVFEPPLANTKTFPAVITETTGDECGVTSAGWYRFARTKFSMQYGSPGMVEMTGQDAGIAFNLLELTGSNLGGSIAGAECGVVWDYTVIPAGTHIIVTEVGRNPETGTPYYGFVIPNDTCINCCTEGLLQRAGKKQHLISREGSDIESLMMRD